MTEQEKREKVIKGFGICIRVCKECTKCPYNNTPSYECIDNLKRDVLALLKAQEPVEPTIGGAEWGSLMGSRWYECGACEYPIDKGDRYCRHCGRPVKWE